MKSPIGLLQLGSVLALGTLAATRLVRRFKPDHVLCFWVFPPGLWAEAACRLSKTPYSVWALGSDIWVLGKVPGMPAVLSKLGRSASKRYADGLVLADDFAKICQRDVEFLPTSRVVTPPAGETVGAGGYYLYLGRYHPNKGIDILIEALGKVRGELPSDFRLRVHGFGPLEEAIKRRVRELQLENVVEILGPTPASEVETILRRARGLIIPSRIESVPLVLSDGLQMELPLLVTDVGDMGTLVRKYDAGVVCRPEADDMAAALLRFLKEPPPSGGRALRELLDIRGSVRRFLQDIEPGRPA
jgi:glycosyltransferase involved in cell wall biosynthesis